MSGYIDWPRYSRLTWIGAVLLILLLLLLWLSGHGPGSSALCCGKPIGDGASVAVAPAAPTTVAPVKPAGDLSVVYQAGKATLAGTVADAATHDRLLLGATTVYGAGNVNDKLRIDPGVSPAACARRWDALLSWLRFGNRSGIQCSGDGVTLVGVVASEAERMSRVQSARELFGADAPIVDQLVVVVPLTKFATVADVKCGGGSISATVEFASDSTALGTADMALLDAIAACLNDGQYEIGGHTDASGNDDINRPLSQQRAEAVRTYLIGKGVAAANLTAVGYGADRPIADNATEEGKAQNRRIEFSKK